MGLANKPTKKVISKLFKYCPGCTQTKHILDFHKHSGKPDGLQVHCKACIQITQAIAANRKYCPRCEKYKHDFDNKRDLCNRCVNEITFLLMGDF